MTDEWTGRLVKSNGGSGDRSDGERTDAAMSTPVRRQYLAIKRQYPDVVVFFRMGDFYETFDGDAQLAAQVLDITLTSRELGRDVRTISSSFATRRASSSKVS